MKLYALFFITFLTTSPLHAQTEFTSDNFFPADLEFKELQNVVSEDRFSDSKQLSDIENGRLITEVGFDNYAQRTYAAGDFGSLSIEVATLIDYRAAYSLLSLIRNSDIKDGPPGEAYASNPGRILFCHGKRWVRIRGRNISDTLLQRVAAAVSNRMGNPERKFPSLISHLPESGLESASLEYFPCSKPFESFHSASPKSIIQVHYDMEIARARYSLKNQSGILTLLEFPTPELAEEYYSELSAASPPEKTTRIYLKRSGALVCVLEGAFNPDRAKEILDPIQYSYSVQWIYDKKAVHATVWGIPTVILNSTVLSFFLALAACISSILAGAGLAGFRLLLRRFVPRNPWDDPKQTELTRLRLP
jgi:hypothetical protein